MISHIIAKHGVEVLDPVVETIVKGKVTFREKGKMFPEHGDHVAVLRRGDRDDDSKWLLSGYKVGRENKQSQPVERRFPLDRVTGPIFFTGGRQRRR